MDRLSRERRSRLMSSVRSRDTKPERIVRSEVHRAGYRFRLQRRDLPGKPDLVFPSRRIAVFVHGCFWHQHTCRRGRVPGSNADYWAPKLARNVARDESSQAKLIAAGWKPVLVWECEIESGIRSLLKLLRRSTIRA